MSRRNLIATLGLASVLAVGCTDNQIGRPCNNLNQSPQNGASFINPAPDCPSRLCLVTPPAVEQPGASSGTVIHTSTLAMCTASCDTDADCATSGAYTTTTTTNGTTTGCSSYVCAVPSVVPGAENFCCQKLCMCAADLIPGFNENDPRGGPTLPKDSSGVTIPSYCTTATACNTP